MSVQDAPKLSRDSICKWLNENESQIISASLSFAPSPALSFFLNRFIPGHYEIKLRRGYGFVLPEGNLI